MTYHHEQHSMAQSFMPRSFVYNCLYVRFLKFGSQNLDKDLCARESQNKNDGNINSYQNCLEVKKFKIFQLFLLLMKLMKIMSKCATAFHLWLSSFSVNEP